MSLKISNLSVSYAQHQVLNELSVEGLESGSFTGLLGPNAAGKSTLFKAVAGLIKSNAGELHLNGVNLAKLSRTARAGNVAYLSQQFHTNLALSVFESVLLALKQRSKWRVKQQDLFKVSEILSTLGIGDLADKDICELSGGQKQLVAMARILVVDPKVVLLDEPTSALDLHHQLAILDVVRKLTISKGLITIAALHDVNLAAKYCDRLILLNDGKIQVSGPASEVLAMPVLGESYKVLTSLEQTRQGQLYVDAQLLAKSA
ncbi:MAG: ABC transporter ATP-binding protein [Oceanospirillaceae bacterium]